MDLEAEVYGWMVDFVVKTEWKKFRANKSIDASTRDHIQGILVTPFDRSRRLQKVRILKLIAYLCDGEDYEQRYSEDADLTVLEEVLKIFNKLIRVQDSGLQEEGEEKIRDLIMEQAVFVCCREDDFDTASEVFDRVWSDSARDTAKQSVIEVLESKDKDHELLKQQTYANFTENICEFIQKIVDGFPKPVLLEFARYLYTGPENGDSAGDLENANNSSIKEDLPMRSFNMQVLKKTAEMLAVNETDEGIELTPRQQKQLSSRLEKLRKKNMLSLFGLHTKGEGANNSDSEFGREAVGHGHMSPRKPQYTSPAKRKPVTSNDRTSSHFTSDLRYRKNVNRPNRHDLEDSPVSITSSSNGESSESEDDSTKGKRRQRRKPGAKYSDVARYGPSTPKRKKWTDSESEEFFDAVVRIGAGKWKDIRDVLGTARTEVNLKDRWRTMLQRGDVDRLRRERNKARELRKSKQ